jgi:hypothetical protein
MKVRFPSEYLRLAKVFGYPYELSGNEVVIDFKDFFSEQKKSVLIKFDITGKVSRKLTFENELTYEDVNNNFRLVTETGTNNIEPAASRDEYSKNRNETVVQNISMFESNEMMENALKEADDGNFEQARVLLQNARGYMDDQMKDVAPSPEMRRQSENIDN